MCLWTRTAAGVELMISNGAACLCRLVSGNQNFFNIHFKMCCVLFSAHCLIHVSAYREPYLFVTYFNSLDVIEIQGHAALG